jgi:parallel beta-helix repeat protein
MPEAHYPNLSPRNIRSAEPYLRTAGDSRVVKARGQETSTEVVVGPDLHLPPGVRLGDGARVRIRTGSWLIDEATVQESIGNRLVLSKPTSFPLKAGWGYFLLGQLWMLDSPGEWFHDRGTGMLYFWPPEGRPRSEAVRVTMLAMGIDLRARRFVTIDGLAMRHVRTGVAMSDTLGVEVINSTFDRITDDGIDAHGSKDAKLASNSFNRIGGNAIEGGGRHNGPANRLSAIGNFILNSGIEIEGDSVISLPRNSYAGILAGTNANIIRNTIANVGYIGIRVRSGSRVEENLVSGACSVLDDCGGIYVWSDRAVRIARNTVLHTRGNTAGKPSNEASQGRGIYLDESVNRSIVESNVVVDADHGLMIHVSSNNSLVGNFLYGNRSSQIWMQVSRNRERATGDLYENDVSNNVVAATEADSVGFRLENPFGDLTGFGQFRGNRFFDRNATSAVDLQFLGLRRRLTTQEWRRGFVGLPAERDGAGWAASDSAFAAYSISGKNLIPTRSESNSGWVPWNANPPASHINWRDCAPGRCISVVPGGSSTLLSSPSFDLLKDKLYRLTVDVRAETDDQALELIVRRGGGGSNGYESLSHKRLASTADRQWRRISTVFRATKTVLAGDPRTGDVGARVDFEQLVAGRSIEVANLEIVPIAYSTTAAVSIAFVNPGGSAVLVDCPFSSGAPELCGRLFSAAAGARARWPIEVPAHSARLLYGEEESLRDADRDGISDSADSCPMTRPGSPVNSAGCPLVIQ